MAAGLKPVKRDGVISSRDMEAGAEKTDRIHVPVTFRVPLIQRLHVGREAGHLGYERTLARLRERYIWGRMAKDVVRVMKTCVQCRKNVKIDLRKRY